VAVAADGTLAAIHERSRIAMIELPSCAKFAELPLDADTESEAIWVGILPRLLVLARFPKHTIVGLIDPFGPRTIAELRFESAMRLVAAVGSHALVLGAQEGAVVLTAADHTLTSATFPARSLPVAVGSAGERFIVALAGALEEWDPQTRLPKRRFKLPASPSAVTALGGSDRVVWLTTQDHPRRVDVIPLVDRGQPKEHELPEPVAQLASHARSDLVACVGSSGRMWVIDLAGRTGLRMVGPQGIDRVEAAAIVHGAMTGVLAAQTKRPIALVALEQREAAGPPVRPTQERISRASSPVARASSPPTRASSPVVRAESVIDAGATSITPDTDAPLSAFRERVRASTVSPPPAPSFWSDAPETWRDDLVAWTRAILADETPDVPVVSPIETILTRHDLAPELYRGVALLYGAHLIGEEGASPHEVSRVAGWREALGRGDLYTSGVAVYASSRVRLAPAPTSVLDELPPLAGTLVGKPGGLLTLLGPCVLVASGPLSIVAEACLPSIGGAILAAHDGSDPLELVYEARAYGAAPMVRMTATLLEHVPTDQPIILAVDDEATADSLGLPRLS